MTFRNLPTQNFNKKLKQLRPKRLTLTTQEERRFRHLCKIYKIPSLELHLPTRKEVRNLCES